MIEETRKVFAGPIAFLKSAPDLKFLPDMAVNEVAFSGRSNDGKSTQMNAQTNRNGIDRTYKKPARTKELNFFYV